MGGSNTGVCPIIQLGVRRQKNKFREIIEGGVGVQEYEKRDIRRLIEDGLPREYFHHWIFFEVL